MTVNQIINALPHLSAKDRLAIYDRLRADAGLSAYRALLADAERVKRERRERSIKRRAAQATHVRAAREKLKKKPARLKTYTLEEFLQE